MLISRRSALADQGIEWVHIPIPLGAPENSHVRAVSDALVRLQARRVLVPCQVSMRVSSMVFLRRVIRGREDPALAAEAVAKVWSPRGPWRQLFTAPLARHQIGFEPS